MIRKQIKELLERYPFVPFRLELPSGKVKHSDVLDPAMTVLMKAEIFVAFPDGEHASLIPLLHVTSADVKRNGRGTRRGKRK